MAGESPQWTDRYRYAWLLALTVPLLPLACYLLVQATGWEFFWWGGPLFLFCIVPVLEWWLGRESTNPPEELMRALQNDRYYRWCTYAFIPLQYAALCFACFVVATHSWSLMGKRWSDVYHLLP